MIYLFRDKGGIVKKETKSNLPLRQRRIWISQFHHETGKAKTIL
jgi:hypothetical protein